PSLGRQSSPEFHRPYLFQGGARRFPLRAAWFQHRRHPQSQASQSRDGICQRDGRTVPFGTHAYCGSADDCEERWTLKTPPSAHVARRLAALAILTNILAPLVVLLPRARAPTLRSWIFDPPSPWSGLPHAEHQSRHSHVSG